MDLYDFTIIGGGPTGLFGAFYAGLRQMRTKLIDSMPQLGGQLSALYPEKYIYDVGGFPKVLAKDLVAQFADQALQYNPTLCLSEKVVGLERVGDDTAAGGYLQLTTDKGAVHYSKTVLLAAGVGAFLPRKMDIPDLDRLEGLGVHYFVTDPASLKGKRLVIVGGGDSAFDWSLALGPSAASCIQIHRSDRFKAHEDSIQKVQDLESVELRTFYELKALHGEEHLEAVTIFDNRTGEEERVECDEVLLNLGFLTNLGPIKEWGLALEKNTIKVDSTMRTNIIGVYSAGDICSYVGKLKLIATGVGEAGTAANFAKTFLDPASKAFPGHSSEMH
ncbi:NAD(P)/FAD-dependent oxidoreductase [Armatimonas rosea]|uniref:Ferredoxin--NADP reductase n=1 Tax=Armatimonas rosea TaxID=685828 RepID=A0A7W9W6T8_ARMRO|nr:NAD(P)/FAD-dependent oxidoreductase [Armatimonas rosea]MBB6050943.1 thioredoxin reductase (NADPH) [Armatimonas rosea]